MRHFRAESEGGELSAEEVLKSLNPKGLRTIALTDIVSATQSQLVKRVPLIAKSRVEVILRDFHTTQRSFQMPTEIFRRLYARPSHPSPQRPRSRPVVRGLQVSLRKRLQHLSQERLYIKYDASFKEIVASSPHRALHSRQTVRESPLRSSPLSATREGSYANMHSKKETRRKEQQWADIKTAQAVVRSMHPRSLSVTDIRCS